MGGDTCLQSQCYGYISNYADGHYMIISLGIMVTSSASLVHIQQTTMDRYIGSDIRQINNINNKQ